MTIASLGDVLEPAFVQARGTLCTVDASGPAPVCNGGARTDVTATAGVMRRYDLGTQNEPVSITSGLGHYWTRPGAPTHFVFNAPPEGQSRIWNIKVTSAEPIVLESFDDLGFTTTKHGESQPPTVDGQVTTQRIVPGALRTIRVTLGAASHATQAQFELQVIYEDQGPSLVYDACPPDQTGCPLLPYTGQVGGTPYTAATATGIGDFSQYYYAVPDAGTYTVTLTGFSDIVELQLQGFEMNSDGTLGAIISGADASCNDTNAIDGTFTGTCSVTLAADTYLGIVVLGGFTDDEFGAVFTINVAKD